MPQPPSPARARAAVPFGTRIANPDGVEVAVEPGEPVRARLVLPEWLEAGLLGALVVMVVVFAADAWSGDALHTPSVLGTLVITGFDPARAAPPLPGAAVVYHVLHFALWIGLGLAATRLVRRAEDDPARRWLLGVGALLAVVALLAAQLALRELAPARPHLLAGGLAGLAALGAFLVWRHPGALRRSPRS